MKKRHNKKRRRSRTIRIIQGGERDISTKRLEIAKSQLIHAQLLSTEAKISFNFVQRLVDEVLRRRREEDLLHSEIEDIIQELKNEEGYDYDSVHLDRKHKEKKEDVSSIVDIDSEDLLSEKEFLLSDTEGFSEAFEEEAFDIDDFSIFEKSNQGQRVPKREGKDRKERKWPI